MFIFQNKNYVIIYINIKLESDNLKEFQKSPDTISSLIKYS